MHPWRKMFQYFNTCMEWKEIRNTWHYSLCENWSSTIVSLIFFSETISKKKSDIQTGTGTDKQVQSRWPTVYRESLIVTACLSCCLCSWTTACRNLGFFFAQYAIFLSLHSGFTEQQQQNGDKGQRENVSSRLSVQHGGQHVSFCFDQTLWPSDLCEQHHTDIQANPTVH